MTNAHRSSIPASFMLFAASVALVGATRCGGEAKSDLGAAAGTSQGGGAATAGGSGTTGGGSHNVGGAGPVGGGPIGSSGSDSAGSPSACGGSPSLPVGRPKAPSCAATPVDTPGPSAHACTVDGDCADAGADARCLGSKCGFDQCLVDSDCPSGQACRCSNQLRGNVFAGNSCVPTGCRVDADCRPNGTCSPDTSGRCGSLSGYQCHSASDTCNSDADCCGSTPRCGYQPELGHWACSAVILCNG